MDKAVSKINQILLLMGGVCLVVMILLTSANIFFRLFGIPVRGTFELMGYFGAVATAFALAYTEETKGHIAVDVLINTFSPKIQNALRLINNLILCIFFIFITVKLYDKGMLLVTTGEVTETLRIIYYPFTFMTALGLAVLTLTFALNLFKNVISLFRSAS